MTSPDNVSPVAGTLPGKAVTPPSSIPSAPSGAPGGNMEKISSLAQLREKEPKLYNMMLQGIGMSIVNQMHESQDRLKQMMDEAERDAEGNG